MKTTTYPEQYLLITDTGSGENTIIELGVNALLDIETLVTEYFDELGVSVRICGHSATTGGFSLLTCSMGSMGSASRICAVIGAGVAALVAPPVGGPGIRSRIRRCSMILQIAPARLGRSLGSLSFTELINSR
jgi:hypothetical protein